MKTGLVLEGGGIKGSYQIGAYKALIENKIKFDGFTGTSIGSFNAAILAAGKYDELYEFWSTIDPGVYLEADQRLIDAIQSDRLKLKSLIFGSLSSFKTWIKGKGIPIDGIMGRLEEILDVDAIYNSDVDFGLVTVRQKDFKPLYLTKENINKDKFIEYIVASCYLPVFQRRKIIDDNFYLDGGFYDNAPISILLNKNYKKIYLISNNAIGMKQKISNQDKEKIIRVSPSRNICAVLEMNRARILENIEMGYYDTLRVIKNYDGYKYTFKRTPKFIFKLLSRKISSRKYQRVESFLGSRTKKETVIKALEYVAEKEEIDYYNVYSFYKLLRKIQKSDLKKHFVYDFIRELKLF